MTSSPRSVASTAVLILGWWVAIAAAVLGLGWLITHPAAGAVNGFDDPINRWFVGERTPWLDHVAEVGTFLGETQVGEIVVLVVGVGFSLWRRTLRPLLFVVVIEVSIGTLYRLATQLEPRDRPPVKILDTGLVPDHSFPSGHVATATVAYATIVVLSHLYARSARRWVLPLLLVPVLVLLARLYQGAHHLTDVLTSLTYATVLLLVLARLVLPSPEGAEPGERA